MSRFFGVVLKPLEAVTFSQRAWSRRRCVLRNDPFNSAHDDGLKLQRTEPVDFIRPIFAALRRPSLRIMDFTLFEALCVDHMFFLRGFLSFVHMTPFPILTRLGYTIHIKRWHYHEVPWMLTTFSFPGSALSALRAPSPQTRKFCTFTRRRFSTATTRTCWEASTSRPIWRRCRYAHA